MNVVIGVCQLTFHLPGNRSLKGKRQIVRRMTERVRSRFQISIGEVDDLDRHQQACIGLSLVGNDRRKLQSVLDQILQTIEHMYLAPLIDQQVEFLQYGKRFGYDRPLHDPEAIKRDSEDEEFYGEDEFGDDNYDDDFHADNATQAKGGKEGDPTKEPPDAPWASQGAANPWAFLDEWED